MRAGAILETFRVMMLRSFPFRALMVATLAIAVMPLHGQSTNKQSDASSQQANGLPYPGKVVEQIVARVDDQVIDTSDYKRAEQDLEQQAQQQNMSQAELDREKKDLLRNLIDQQLLLAKGKQLGITGEDQLVERLDAIRKQNHLDSMQALQQAVESQGLSWQDFKQQIRNNIITQTVIRQKVAPTIRISPDEIQKYYDAHKKEFDRPEEVRLSEILIPTPNPDDAAQVAAAKKKADSIEAKLKAGADFAKLAKADSKGPTAAQGGDLGAFQKGQLAPELESATFSLKKGQFTEPIQTKQGWIILEVTHHQDAGVAPMSQVETQIENAVGYNKMQPALRAYLTKLRNESYIDIRPGYTDAGATPNEMKPIYSAYVPPSGKKKKAHMTRVRYDAYHRGRHYRRKKTVKTEVASAPASAKESRKLRRERRKERAGIQKPGKREKIRFGQAPRENLPPVLGQQPEGVDTGSGVEANAATAQPAGTGNAAKKRFGSKSNEHHAKKVDDHHPAAVVGTAAEATMKVQQSSLGLEGNTDKKKKKKHPLRGGPKRRYSKVQLKKDQEQKKAAQQQAQPASTSGTPASDSGNSQPQQ
jgi:peptidyl-prolyl cis-trans isomerase SurA